MDTVPTVPDDENPVIDRLTEALQILGCVSIAQAEILLYAAPIELTAREINAILTRFTVRYPTSGYNSGSMGGTP